MDTLGYVAVFELFTPTHSGTIVTPAAILTGLTVVAAMSVQNAASRTVFAALSPTTMMTGNTTRIVLDLLELSRGASAMRPRERAWARAGRRLQRSRRSPARRSRLCRAPLLALLAPLTGLLILFWLHPTVPVAAATPA